MINPARQHHHIALINFQMLRKIIECRQGTTCLHFTFHDKTRFLIPRHKKINANA